MNEYSKLTRVSAFGKLIRPSQQIKNGAVLLGALGSGTLLNWDASVRTLLTILCWITLSGAIYILNDISDLKTDRNHPVKSMRPLAASLVTIKQAWLIAFFLVLISLSLANSLDSRIFVIAIMYLVINTLYSAFLKNVAVIDLLFVSSGFVLRGLSGIYAVDALPSLWFLLLSLFGSLLLISGKRLSQKNEIAINSKSHRASIDNYSENFLIQLQTICSTGLLICYLMMTQEKNVDSDVQRILLDFSIVPFLAIIVYINYFQDKYKESDITQLMFNRKPFTLAVFIWFVLFLSSLVA